MNLSQMQKAIKNDREKFWVCSRIKGRIAETLIEELFINLGYQVFKYGMENTVPGIMGLIKGVNDEVSIEIKRMPDFVVYKDGKAHFIEVKYRSDEAFSFEDLNKKGEYPYHSVLVVLVSKKHIKALTYEEMKAGEKFTHNGNNYLGYRKEFKNDKEKIIEYCQHAIKFFKHV